MNIRGERRGAWDAAGGLDAAQDGSGPSGQEQSGAKVVAQGLALLRVLVEARGSLTSTEIARRMGLHQSTASRILRALLAAGYVRKPDYHSFAPDYGLLTLGGLALRHFPLSTVPRQVLVELAERAQGLMVSLATLWKEQVIFFLRTQKGHEPTPAFVGEVGLQLSSPALVLLLALPRKEAKGILERSRKKSGWERPTAQVPATAEGVLSEAAALVRHGCLPLLDWQGPGRISCAIPLQLSDQPPVALVLSGPQSALPLEEVLLLLQEGRHAVEEIWRRSRAQG